MSPGIINRHERKKPLFYRMTVMFKRCVTLTVPHAIGVLLPNRFGCWRPNNADFIIANINGGSGRIADRIVEPRRETMVLAIAAPDTFCAGLGNQCAEFGVRQDVNPRKRRVAAGPQINEECLS